ncbi:MAG: ATP-binding protein [Acidobacteria bacterium]|nr:ATP-binding protein [Acidobacteriota bacterium]
MGNSDDFRSVRDALGMAKLGFAHSEDGLPLERDNSLWVPDGLTRCGTCQGGRRLRGPGLGESRPCPVCNPHGEQRPMRIWGSTEDELRRRTFDMDLRGRPSVGTALRRLQDWVDAPTGWLTLIGGPGVGKSHMAAAAAMRMYDDGRSVIYALVPRLLARIQASWDGHEHGDERIMSWLRSYQVVILDDFGAEQQSSWSEARLLQVLELRLNRPTLITTNILPDLFEDRIRSRLMDHRHGHIGIEAPDYRSGETALSRLIDPMKRYLLRRKGGRP